MTTWSVPPELRTSSIAVRKASPAVGEPSAPTTTISNMSVTSSGWADGRLRRQQVRRLVALSWNSPGEPGWASPTSVSRRRELRLGSGSHRSGAAVRILLVSDLHYSLPQLDWVVNAAPAFDLVVVAGDSLNISSAVSPDAQSAVVLRYLAMLQAA